MPDRYAIIVGSGFDSLADGQELAMTNNAYGEPSGAIQRVTIAGTDVLTIARHGAEHTLAPHAINYRANLVALREAGTTSIIALHTVGVVNDQDCGQLAVPSQLLDYTWGREHTLYDAATGSVQHIEFTEPFSAVVRERLLAAASAASVGCYDGGVYATLQGPRLETAAEVDRLHRDGADYVGMTAMPEAALARELDLQYASLSLLVNPAAGRGEAPIHAAVATNTAKARSAAMALLEQFFVDLE